MNSGSLPKMQEEAWAEARVVEGQRMAEGVLITGTIVLTGCLPTVFPRLSPLYSRGGLTLFICRKLFSVSGIGSGQSESWRLGVGGVRE